MQNLVGWIGTGVMGSSMCKHLLKANYSLQVFNRTQSKTEELIQLGAQFKQPEEIAQNCNIIVLMLGYPHDVKDIVFNKLYDNLKPGQIIIDHTTSSPQLAQEIYQKLKEKQVESIDAPVSGGDVGAREGKLAIMCGGDKSTMDKINDIFQKYGTNIQYLGPAGSGQHCKMGNQICIANNMIGVVEGLMYAYKSGLDLTQFLDTIKTGAAGSKSLEVLGPRMIKGNFDPGFYVEHFMKDMEIAVQECQRFDLTLPGLQQSKKFYQDLIDQGGAREGTQAIIKVLEKMNKINIRQERK